MKEFLIDFLSASAKYIGGFPEASIHALSMIGTETDIERIENLAADVINKYEHLPVREFMKTPEYAELAKKMRDVNSRFGIVKKAKHPLEKKRKIVHENSGKRDITS
jgi:pantoate kinase